MTIKTTGPLSLTDIVTEFGGTAPHGISEYYAGGASVPAGTIGFPGGVSTPIPAAGVISWSNFYGAMKQIGLGAALRFRANNEFTKNLPAGSNQILTLSAWVKRAGLGDHALLNVQEGGVADDRIGFGPDDKFYINTNNGRESATFNTKAVFRDVSAWYHIVVSLDTTKATPSDRCKIYVNGVLQELEGDIPVGRVMTGFGSGRLHHLGKLATSGNGIDGYLADVNFVGGQVVAASAFGETDPNGMWKSKKYSGTYGTNGFHLDFSKGATPLDFGKDSSGNGNDWSVNGFDASDWVKDVPTLSKDDTADYATLNPLLGNNQWWSAKSRGNLLNGNLTYNAQDTCVFSTFDLSVPGKWYAEVQMQNLNGGGHQIILSAASRNTFEVSYASSGQKQINAAPVEAYGHDWVTGAVIGVAVDSVAGKTTFYYNGVAQPDIVKAFPKETVLLGFNGGPSGGAAHTVNFNFGQQPFKHPPPAGFKPLNTFNLPEPVIKKPEEHFKVEVAEQSTLLASSRAFAPNGLFVTHNLGGGDFFWMDSLNKDQTQALTSNEGGHEKTYAPTGGNAVGYTWKTDAAAVANSDGATPSRVSANKLAGFSIVEWTAAQNTTIGHGLGAKPEVMILKSRDGAGGHSWNSYFQYAGPDATGVLPLNNPGSFAVNSNFFNNTPPTDKVFTVGTDLSLTVGGTHVGYCWHSIPGYSKMGVYTGNGATDGTFVYCGFRPEFILIKNANFSSEWVIYDTRRNTYNPSTRWISPNSPGAETVADSGAIDILANGFKLRAAGGYSNGAASHVFMAFAEHPFKYSNAR